MPHVTLIPTLTPTLITSQGRKTVYETALYDFHENVENQREMGTFAGTLAEYAAATPRRKGTLLNASDPLSPLRRAFSS